VGGFRGCLNGERGLPGFLAFRFGPVFNEEPPEGEGSGRLDSAFCKKGGTRHDRGGTTGVGEGACGNGRVGDWGVGGGGGWDGGEAVAGKGWRTVVEGGEGRQRGEGTEERSSEVGSEGERGGGGKGGGGNEGV